MDPVAILFPAEPDGFRLHIEQMKHPRRAAVHTTMEIFVPVDGVDVWFVSQLFDVILPNAFASANKWQKILQNRLLDAKTGVSEKLRHCLNAAFTTENVANGGYEKPPDFGKVKRLRDSNSLDLDLNALHLTLMSVEKMFKIGHKNELSSSVECLKEDIDQELGKFTSTV